MPDTVQPPREDAAARSNSSSMIGGAAQLASANAATMALGLAIAILATRCFTAEAYGRYILLCLMSSFLTQVSTLGLGASSSRFLAISDDADTRSALVSTTLTLRLIAFGVVSGLALVLGAPLFQLFDVPPDATVWFYMIALYFCDSYGLVLQSILQGCRRFRQIAIWNVSSSVLNLLLLVILTQSHGDPVTVLVAARWIAYMAAGFYMLMSIPTGRRLALRLDLAKQLIAFGFPLQLNDMLSYVYGRADRLLVAGLLGPASLAYYDTACRIPDSLTTFFDAMRISFFPSFVHLYAKDRWEEAGSLLRNALRLTTFACLLCACVAFLFGRDIMLLLFSATYAPAAPLFAVITPSVALVLIGHLLGNSLVAVGESDKPAKINLVHAAVSLGANVLLIPQLGMLGAALTRLAGPAATNPLNYLCLHRKFPVYILSSYVKPILVFAVWIAGASLLHLEPFLARIGALIVFVLINVLASVLVPDDVALLRLGVRAVLRTRMPQVGSHGRAE